MNIVNDYVGENYQNILQWAKQISYNHEAYEDLAHDVIASFMVHDKAQELIERGEARWFITRMLLNQGRSNSSPFAKYYKNKYEYNDRAIPEHEVEDYNTEIDFKIETVQGIIEDLKAESIEGWYSTTVFEQVLLQPKMNFSKLAKETGIPRTSISQAYYTAVEMIKNRIQQHGDTD